MVFPSAFFDIMIRLLVHLAEEAKVGVLVCYRWMYPVERYLRTVNGYVRNKAQPEGSIAEAYIAEECLTFCSLFFDIDTKLSRPDRHENIVVNEPLNGLRIFSEIDYKRRGNKIKNLENPKLHNMRHYIITNCDEAGKWVE
jgi:hypothetical protein